MVVVVVVVMVVVVAVVVVAATQANDPAFIYGPYCVLYKKFSRVSCVKGLLYARRGGGQGVYRSRYWRSQLGDLFSDHLLERHLIAQL